jgi:hypothetical protein
LFVRYEKQFIMLLTQYLYRIYLRGLAAPLILGLVLIQWKKNRVQTNLKLLRLPVTFGFRLRFYAHAAMDALKVLHANYGQPIHSRPRDQLKLNRLRLGPALFLSAHFHNWELMGSWLCVEKNIPLLSVALPFKQPISQFFLKILRRRLRVPIIDTDITRLALRHLQAGRCLGMLWDQSPQQSRVSVPLFSYSVKVDPLPGFLAEKSRAPVFVGALLPGGLFRIVQIAHAPCYGWSPEKLACRYHRILEILVRAYPDYWYGLAHRRFKDHALYGVMENVSRETTRRSPLLVSRETKRGS